MNTSAKGGLRSRQKGKRGEREIVRLARACGLEAERTWQTAQSSDPIMRRCDMTVAGQSVQVRIARRGFERLYQVLDGVTVAFLRQDRRPWLAVLPATEFLAMLREKPAPKVNP